MATDNNASGGLSSSSLELSDNERQLEEYERKLVLFGTDVGSIPCYRNTFLYGLTSGFAGGIAHFAFFSRISNATRFGVYSFVGVTLSYWIYCRWNYAVTRFKHKQIKQALILNQQWLGTPQAFPFANGENQEELESGGSIK